MTMYRNTEQNQTKTGARVERQKHLVLQFQNEIRIELARLKF